MKRLAAALRRRPVRAYLYSLLVPGAAVATYYGLTTQNAAVLWVALGGAVLAVGGAEVAQTKTTPVADPRTRLGTPAELVPDNPEESMRFYSGGEIHPTNPERWS